MPIFDKWKKKLHPRFGQHIRVKRKCGIGFFYHHGIYVSDSEVINFNGEPGKKSVGKSNIEEMKDALIVRSTIKEFLNGGILEVNTAKRKHTPQEIVNYARNSVGKRRGEYNLVTNNCEHFCNECCDGNHTSKWLWRYKSEFIFICKNKFKVYNFFN